MGEITMSPEASAQKPKGLWGKLKHAVQRRAAVATLGTAGIVNADKAAESYGRKLDNTPVAENIRPANETGQAPVPPKLGQ